MSWWIRHIILDRIRLCLFHFKWHFRQSLFLVCLFLMYLRQNILFQTHFMFLRKSFIWRYVLYTLCFESTFIFTHSIHFTSTINQMILIFDTIFSIYDLTLLQWWMTITILRFSFEWGLDYSDLTLNSFSSFNRTLFLKWFNKAFLNLVKNCTL